jgi:hypothetical protein
MCDFGRRDCLSIFGLIEKLSNGAKISLYEVVLRSCSTAP